MHRLAVRNSVPPGKGCDARLEPLVPESDWRRRGRKVAPDSLSLGLRRLDLELGMHALLAAELRSGPLVLARMEQPTERRIGALRTQAYLLAGVCSMCSLSRSASSVPAPAAQTNLCGTRAAQVRRLRLRRKRLPCASELGAAGDDRLASRTRNPASGDQPTPISMLGRM